MFGSSIFANWFRAPDPIHAIFDDYVGKRAASPSPNTTAGDTFYTSQRWIGKSHHQKQRLVREALQVAADVAGEDPRFLRHVRRSLRLDPQTIQIMPPASEIARSVTNFVAYERDAVLALLRQAETCNLWGQLDAAQVTYREALERLSAIELPEKSELLDNTYRDCFLLWLVCKDTQGALSFLRKVAPRAEALFPVRSPQWSAAQQEIEQLVQFERSPAILKGLRQAAASLGISFLSRLSCQSRQNGSSSSKRESRPSLLLCSMKPAATAGIRQLMRGGGAWLTSLAQKQKR